MNEVLKKVRDRKKYGSKAKLKIVAIEFVKVLEEQLLLGEKIYFPGHLKSIQIARVSDKKGIIVKINKGNFDRLDYRLTLVCDHLQIKDRTMLVEISRKLKDKAINSKRLYPHVNK